MWKSMGTAWALPCSVASTSARAGAPPPDEDEGGGQRAQGAEGQVTEGVLVRRVQLGAVADESEPLAELPPDGQDRPEPGHQQRQRPVRLDLATDEQAEAGQQEQPVDVVVGVVPPVEGVVEVEAVAGDVDQERQHDQRERAVRRLGGAGTAADNQPPEGRRQPPQHGIGQESGAERLVREPLDAGPPLRDGQLGDGGGQHQPGHPWSDRHLGDRGAPAAAGQGPRAQGREACPGSLRVRWTSFIPASRRWRRPAASSSRAAASRSRKRVQYPSSNSSTIWKVHRPSRTLRPKSSRSRRSAQSECPASRSRCIAFSTRRSLSPISWWNAYRWPRARSVVSSALVSLPRASTVSWLMPSGTWWSGSGGLLSVIASSRVR